MGSPGEWWKSLLKRQSLMEKTSQSDCWCANEAGISPSIFKEGPDIGAARRWRIPLNFSLSLLFLAIFLGGCGTDASKPAPQAETKPAEPAVPEDIQLAAKALLGSESQVLLFGDLAKNRKQAFLAADVVPKTPTNNLPGTIVTRVVVAENTDGKWAEVLRCDEHLKNQKGFMGLTPLVPVTGWRLQYEQNDEKGLQLYFTPLKGAIDTHVLPIGVRWNPATKRYQSLDRTYEHFLLESPSMQDARSTLR
ncbi:MAG: hypothetical protein DMG50_15425 [Acidobacteria bacterium]|nr:MAG: hypothetical protein DMG50_15425 [Acidobacteriota bacterium]